MKLTEIPTEAGLKAYLPEHLAIDEAVLTPTFLYIPLGDGDEYIGWTRFLTDDKDGKDYSGIKTAHVPVEGRKVKLLGISYTCST